MVSLGYSFYGHDNQSYMFIDGHPFACEQCGSKYLNTYNPEMKLKKKTFDFSATYDGYTVVSKRFVEFLIDKEYHRLNIYPLINHSEFFYFDEFSLPKVKFDIKRREVEFTGECNVCGYNPAYGVTPAYLKNLDKPIERGFYRTDIIFGDSGKEGPLLIVGVETYKELRAEKFKGMDLRAIIN